jgi:hypothetical protein
MSKKDEAILIGVDDQVIELTGVDKDAFIAQRTADLETQRLLEAQYQAKQTARANAITKLAEIAGLTEEEINSIL